MVTELKEVMYILFGLEVLLYLFFVKNEFREPVSPFSSSPFFPLFSPETSS